MTANRKSQIVQLLKGIETGDPASVVVVNEDKYIQHNPQTHEGSEGLARLFERLSKTSPRVNIVRIFEDGDFVFAHTEYDFASRNIGFEIFRFEDGYAVEHWDNIQPRRGPNRDGHSMVDGVTEISDPGQTECNRRTIRKFVDHVLIPGDVAILADYIDQDQYTEHNPLIGSAPAELVRVLAEPANDEPVAADYRKCHRILAEGDFVLTVCEGYAHAVHASFFDLYRLSDGRIVEHWDTTEMIPPRSEWKNTNGKF